MNLLAKLFSKMPSVQELEDKIKEIKLDQKKKQRDLIMLDQAKQEKVKRAVEAKKAGRQEIVKDIYRDASQIEIDIRNTNSDLRRLSLAKAALLSFVRKAEMLEKKKDKKSLQKLVARFNNSSIQKTIDSASVDDDTFNSMLEDVLGEEEDGAVSNKAREDAGYADFEKAIAEMAKTEDADIDMPSKGSKDSRSGSANAQLRYQEIVPGEQHPWTGEVQQSQEQGFITRKLQQIRDVKQKIFALQQQRQEARSQQAFVTQKLQQIRDVKQKIYALQQQGQEAQSQQAFVTQKLQQIRDVKQKIYALQQQGQEAQSQQAFVTQKLQQIRDVKQKIYALQQQGQETQSQQAFVTQKLQQIRDVKQKIYALQQQGQEAQSQQAFVTQKLQQIRDVKQKIYALQQQGQDLRS